MTSHFIRLRLSAQIKINWGDIMKFTHSDTESFIKTNEILQMFSEMNDAYNTFGDKTKYEVRRLIKNRVNTLIKEGLSNLFISNGGKREIFNKLARNETMFMYDLSRCMRSVFYDIIGVEADPQTISQQMRVAMIQADRLLLEHVFVRAGAALFSNLWFQERGVHFDVHSIINLAGGKESKERTNFIKELSDILSLDFKTKHMLLIPLPVFAVPQSSFPYDKAKKFDKIETNLRVCYSLCSEILGAPVYGLVSMCMENTKGAFVTEMGELNVMVKAPERDINTQARAYKQKLKQHLEYGELPPRESESPSVFPCKYCFKHRRKCWNDNFNVSLKIKKVVM